MKSTERYLEIGLPEKMLRIGFMPPAPDGTQSGTVAVRDGDDTLLASFTAADVKAAAAEILIKKPEEPVTAKEARLLACFALAIVHLRPTAIAGGLVAAGDEAAGAAADHAAPVANPGGTV